MKEVPLIEGLRGYLALWVIFDHLLGVCGYSFERLTGIMKFFRAGWYAVDIFIIISGFVIFYLLDNKQETYVKFVIRRFFRLWPLFIVLFAISIPFSLIYSANSIEFSSIFPFSQVGDGLLKERIDSWWGNIFEHILLHLTMLHGIVPNSLITDSPGAFLGPAWSISLEWQFYIIAPFVYAFLRKDKKWAIPIISLFCMLFFFIGKQIDDIEFGAFLPMHIDFFFIGGVSYYFYKSFCSVFFKIIFFPISLVLASFLLLNSDFNFKLIPYLTWLVFFSLLLDFSNPERQNYISVIAGVFSNKIIVYLGKISYSIYLSHLLVIIIIQYIILNFFPVISQKLHLIILSVFSIFFTVFFSYFTHKYIELFYIRKGKLFIDKIKS
ncbi:acyltransferase family protein [Flavobacterium aquicola]|uniref:Peptidoglycan/LPS O-acetylase OafA/YrhL n=1 Tax=Flavobacterium aquicola TaxID=1682742 RepID=A0A3E0EJ32_9FLAO|nr:acyltransferase [Flavobacterium aquicola]REG98262.1 peptidoglycan/LPS O-acetylase OafA/YrhL [Flavobacterium aquicola]